MRTVIVTMCLVIASHLSFGQEKSKKTPEERAEAATKRLEKDLTLTQVQRDKIYSLNLRTVQKNQEIRKKTDLTEEQKKEQLKNNNQNRRKLIMAELTDEQRKILKEKKKEKKEKKEEDDDL